MVKKINEFRELQKKKGKKGFSMIELIIVIAIMAILVALIGTQLIPYLEKSREKRDMTTLDTCKTAFESVVADDEMVIPAGTQTYTIANLTGTNGTAAFYEYAGLSSTDEPFKSEDANDGGTGTNGGSTVGDVKFEYVDGVLNKVTVGNLSISTK